MAIASAIGIPVLIAGLSPVWQSRRRGVWVAVGNVDQFPVGAVQRQEITRNRDEWPRSFSQQTVYIVRPSESELHVLSQSCTDLGCPLDYDARSTCFYCPCHGGIFTKDGSRLAGPPDRPMHRYAHRVRDGVLEVDVLSLPSGV